jgi:hypothetical protein
MNDTQALLTGYIEDVQHSPPLGGVCREVTRMASITGDTLQEQIQKAISAHGIYKFKLAHMVEAESGEIQPPTASADYHCPVGLWLYETLPDPVRASEHCRTVVELHARFHHAAGEVAALSIARRRTEALEAMEPTSTFKKASDQLVQAMEAWAEAVAVPEAEAVAAPEAEEPAMQQPTEPAATPEAGAPPAAEAGDQGEGLQPGWWLDSPTALEAKARESEEHEEQALPEQPAEAEESPQPARRVDVDGMTDMKDWFGLPKAAAGKEASGEEEPSPAEGAEDG